MQVHSQGVWFVCSQTPKEKFEYQGDQRTDRPVVDPATGVPQWGTRGLVYVPELGEFTEATVQVPVAEAEKLTPGAVAKLTGRGLVATLRGAAFSAIAVRVTGVGEVEVKADLREVFATGSGE